MNIIDLANHAADKEHFRNIEQYIDFCIRYLEYIETELQARIISQNEHQYEFFQYHQDGGFNITRPINSNLMYTANNFIAAKDEFLRTLEMLRDGETPSDDSRENLIRFIYTTQQSIGAALDALPTGRANQARKVNGDLFERLIRILINLLNIECISGTMKVPVRDANQETLFNSNYQHDLLISQNNELKIIGSVKTSSKDRIDKVFLDKFLYNRLTNTSLPHIAIFLNDVQRKKTAQENIYAVNGTFLSGHFKAYTIKLNPLDGVYYCDIRPNMLTDTLLSHHIKTIDHFFYTDLWDQINQHGQNLNDILIQRDEIS